MTSSDYSVVIATFERPESLRATCVSLASQTRRAAQVVIVDASPDAASREVVAALPAELSARYERAERPSSAAQRNQGARLVTTPRIAFLDDDVLLPPDTFAKLNRAFDDDSQEKIGGVAARIVGLQHPVPRGLLWWYYRLQAGYAHPTYGGQLFGPAINCLPSYTETAGDLIPATWLNSTCVLYRRPLFEREQFPQFQGYSFLEDVHLSARIAHTHELYFHADAFFEHHDAPSRFKRDARGLTRMRWQNQQVVARDVMHLREPALTLKFLLHRLFVSVTTLRARSPQWREVLLGTWS
ncbi:MAG: glycosyltransferase family 2 protein [Chthoniobacteraceae bacterium]